MMGPPGGFNPTDMLRRLDANNNGQIDPDESSGRARFMLERFARDIPGIDLDKPISIDKLARGIEQRMGGGGPPGSMPGSMPGSSPGGPSAGGSSSGPSSGKPAEEPLVPGFGVLDDMAPPLPFGVRDSSVASLKVNEADLRESEDRMRRYDENRDGFLDKDEVGRSRWSDDPWVYDQNRDGKLTAKELAARYARRRGADSSGGAPASSGGSSFPAFASTSTSGAPGAAAADPRSAMMIQFMMDRYDTNKSGVIEKEEWGNFRSDPSACAANKDGTLTKAEMAAYAQSRMQGGGRASAVALVAPAVSDLAGSVARPA